MLINGLGIGVPYGTSGGGSGGSGSILATSSLYLPLKTTIVPTRGASTPTFTRATTAWDFDNEGKLNLNIPSGCPRFTGARFVRNLFSGTTEDLSSATWTKKDVTITSDSEVAPDGTTGMDLVIPNGSSTTHYVSKASAVGTTVGKLYTVSVYAKAGGYTLLQIAFSGSQVSGDPRINFDLSSGTITANDAGISGAITPLANGVYRVSAIVTAATASLTPLVIFAINSLATRLQSFAGDTVSGVCVWGIQVEDVSGQADQTASEYVSVGVLSAPFHGAGVDGCKYFNTNKDGSAIPAATLKKYLSEPSRVNNCLWGRDATNAAWTKSNITAAKTATGLDNVANSASRLTATANDATLLQLLTAATGTRTTSAWIKAITLTQKPELSPGGGTFDSSFGWTLGSWTIGGGVASIVASPGSILRIASSPAALGKVFVFSYTITSISGANVQAHAGGTLGVLRSTPGTYTESIVCGSVDTLVGIAALSGATATIDNLSIKESAISLTRNGGTGWTDITSSLVAGTWVPVALTSDVGANPTVGLKMGTSGDVIDVDCFQDENGAWRTSPILTTTAAVTRNADVLSYASAFDVAQGTALCQVRSAIPINSGSQATLLDSAACVMLYLTSASARTSTGSYDGTNSATIAGCGDITTGVRKRAVRWGADLKISGDGSLGVATAFDGAMGSTGTLEVGSENSISQISGNIGEVHIWTSALTDAQMQQVTT